MKASRCLRPGAMGARCQEPAQAGSLLCAGHLACDAEARSRDIGALLGRIRTQVQLEPNLTAWPPAREMAAASMDALFDVISRYRSDRTRRREVLRAIDRAYEAWSAAYVAWTDAGFPAPGDSKFETFCRALAVRRMRAAGTLYGEPVLEKHRDKT